MITTLKSKFEENLFLRTENLLHHIYHRSNRFSNVTPELADLYKSNCTSFNNQYREIALLRSNSNFGPSSELITTSNSEPNTEYITCDRNLISDLSKLKYSGKICIRAFIQKVEEFVNTRNIPKDRLLKFAYEIFIDDALHWFRCVKEKVQNWDDLVVLLKHNPLHLYVKY